MTRTFVACAATAACLFAAAAASAQGPVPQLYVGWTADDGGNWTEWNSGAPGTMNVTPTDNPNIWLYNGSHNGSAWSGTWDGWFDIDPAIVHALAITNNTAVTQTFVSIVTIPTVGAISPPSVVEAGVAVSIAAPGFPGTMAAPAGGHIFEAQVGGVSIGPLGELLAFPFSLSTGPLGQTNASGPHNVGPGPGPGLDPIDTIGIRYHFTLTPGATATLNGHFIIVPSPAGAALLGLGALAAARRRRHQAH